MIGAEAGRPVVDCSFEACALRGTVVIKVAEIIAKKDLDKFISIGPLFKYKFL